MGGEISERRNQIRFNLRAPVNFSWTDSAGAVHYGEGVTRDISSHGVYVRAEWRPPEEAHIHVDISLPSLLETNKTLVMTGKAKVVRVEVPIPDENSGGFVAQSGSFLLGTK